MPHADHSTFTTTTKAEAYSQLLESLRALTNNNRFWPTNTANTASLLWHLYHSLPEPSDAVNWAGFYVSSTKAGELWLGPFMGKVACQVIKVGKGVCGTAAASCKTVLVDDVETFPGHIACDSESRSEIVVPIVKDGKCLGVIDVDCAEVHGFDEDDRKGLEAVAQLLADSCDW